MRALEPETGAGVNTGAGVGVDAPGECGAGALIAAGGRAASETLDPPPPQPAAAINDANAATK